MGAGVVEWGEAHLVDQDEVVAQQGLDGLADAVVGQAAIERLDEVGGREVLDLVAGGDGGVAERDQGVGLARAGGADQGEVLLGRDPFQAGQVRPGRGRDRGRGQVELLNGLGDGEPSGFEPGALVGGVAGSDLPLDQGP